MNLVKPKKGNYNGDYRQDWKQAVGLLDLTAL